MCSATGDQRQLEVEKVVRIWEIVSSGVHSSLGKCEIYKFKWPHLLTCKNKQSGLKTQTLLDVSLCSISLKRSNIYFSLAKKST